MAMLTPAAPRIGKTTGRAMAAPGMAKRPVRKKPKTAAKPALAKRSMVVPPLRPGLINR